jgi:hypothetical protein
MTGLKASRLVFLACRMIGAGTGELWYFRRVSRLT